MAGGISEASSLYSQSAKGCVNRIFSQYAKALTWSGYSRQFVHFTQAGIARALYVTAKTERVIVVRVFVKKTQKTPNNEIKLALQRAKELGK